MSITVVMDKKKNCPVRIQQVKVLDNYAQINNGEVRRIENLNYRKEETAGTYGTVDRVYGIGRISIPYAGT